MKVNLEAIFKTLGWPLGLVAVFSAVLSLFGVDLGVVLAIAGSMLGAQALIALLIDVLKWAGVVGPGIAGKWSAVFNLVAIAGIAVALGLYPGFDFPKLDAQLMIVVQFGSLIFGYIVQLTGTKYVHRALVRGFGLPFQWSA